MSTEMVERVAKAMWAQRVKRAGSWGVELEGWGDGSVPLSNGIMDEAIAAMKAMREMTVEMQVAIHNALEQHTGTMFHDPQITAVAWHAGIDAALPTPSERNEDE